MSRACILPQGTILLSCLLMSLKWPLRCLITLLLVPLIEFIERVHFFNGLNDEIYISKGRKKKLLLSSTRMSRIIQYKRKPQDQQKQAKVMSDNGQVAEWSRYFLLSSFFFFRRKQKATCCLAWMLLSISDFPLFFYNKAFFCENNHSVLWTFKFNYNVRRISIKKYFLWILYCYKETWFSCASKY